MCNCIKCIIDVRCFIKKGGIMASSVYSAFDEFLKNTIRLDPNKTSIARASRDNLISNIKSFSGNDDFFLISSDFNLKYGSFARKTKIKPLDDIDLMICIMGCGREYTIRDGKYFITTINSDEDNDLLTEDGYLSSRKVINRFINKLRGLNDYSKAELHRNQEAVTLKLKSYDWNFDIVPCWHTTTDKFLIPDGSGNWKVTDPRIDNERTKNINQKHKGEILDLIRIMKYWNNRPIAPRINSYLLECMILDYYNNRSEQYAYWIDMELRDLFQSLSTQILEEVYDPKGIQGDLNTFPPEDRKKISMALYDAYQKASKAVDFNEPYLPLLNKDPKSAISKWREIFGDEFPCCS